MPQPALITKICDADLRTNAIEIHQLAGAVTVEAAIDARTRPGRIADEFLRLLGEGLRIRPKA